ncbi:MAG: formylglycine-generating enzyme family protein [Candidatus Competibacter sp.]
MPTEAEWEYACRAGTTTPFYFGTTVSTERANYDGNYVYGGEQKGVYRQKTVDVGQFPANAWGLHDLHGNVWEWIGSEYDEVYSGAELRLCQRPEFRRSPGAAGRFVGRRTGVVAVGRSLRVRPALRGQLRRVPPRQDINTLTFLLFPLQGSRGLNPPGRFFGGERLDSRRFLRGPQQGVQFIHLLGPVRILLNGFPQKLRLRRRPP